MTCRWQEFLSILPHWLRISVDEVGRESLQELRLRIGAPPELVLAGESRWLDRPAVLEDIHFCINTASRYSPWTADSQSLGFLTAPGGHRIGLCGQPAYKEGVVTGFRSLSSICIRIARDFPGISGGIRGEGRSVLILGAPGWGKTTLLRIASGLDRDFFVIWQGFCPKNIRLPWLTAGKSFFRQVFGRENGWMCFPAAQKIKELKWYCEQWDRKSSQWMKSQQGRTVLPSGRQPDAV